MSEQNNLDSYHVTKDDDGWLFKKEGGERATFRTDTKTEMLEKVREHAKNHPMSVKIHKENGGFQEERTFPRSRDPSKSKG